MNPAGPLLPMLTRRYSPDCGRGQDNLGSGSRVSILILAQDSRRDTPDSG
jgi:hypothetical protein